MSDYIACIRCVTFIYVHGHRAPHRRLVDTAVALAMHDPEVQAMDADIDLLRRVLQGDTDAVTHFHKHGGRRYA